MPYAVALVGITCFLAGLAVTGGRFVTAGILIGVGVAAAFWLRWYHLSEIDHAFEKGAGYGTSTRRRIRELPEATDVASLELVVARLRAKLNGEEGD